MYNRFSGKIKQQKLPNFVCSLEGGGISTLYIDCHGPLSGGEGRKRWILVCVAMESGYHAFEILKDMTGKTLASVLFNGVFRWLGIPQRVISDIGSNMNSEVQRLLYSICGIQLSFTARSAAWDNHAERGVHKLSDTLKMLIVSRNISEWKELLTLSQIYVNSTYFSGWLSAAPYEVVGAGRYNVFNTPMLELKEQNNISFDKEWDRRITLWEEIRALFEKRHKIFLSLSTQAFRTIKNLNISPGDIVYGRIFTINRNLAYYSSLTPNWRPFKVLKALSRVTLLAQDLESGRITTRHLRDVVSLKKLPAFPNF